MITNLYEIPDNTFGFERNYEKEYFNSTKFLIQDNNRQLINAVTVYQSHSAETNGISSGFYPFEDPEFLTEIEIKEIIESVEEYSRGEYKHGSLNDLLEDLGN